jgi:hypothetical protein
LKGKVCFLLGDYLDFIYREVCEETIQRFLGGAGLTNYERLLFELRQTDHSFRQIALIFGYKHHSTIIRQYRKVEEKLEIFRKICTMLLREQTGGDTTKCLN